MISFLLGSYVVGLVIGLIGGGGSLIAVPLLMRMKGSSFIEAVEYSLFIVGILNALGAWHYRRILKYQQAICITLFSVMGIIFARWLVLPSLITYVGMSDADGFLVQTFVWIVLISNFIILFHESIELSPKNPNNTLPLLAIFGFVLGVMGSLYGIGGGFLIVPFLKHVLRMHSPQALATSYLVIVMNTFVTIILNYQIALHVLDQYHFLIQMIVFSVFGLISGELILKWIPQRKIQKIFSLLLCLISVLFLFVRSQKIL